MKKQRTFKLIDINFMLVIIQLFSPGISEKGPRSSFLGTMMSLTRAGAPKMPAIAFGIGSAWLGCSAEERAMMRESLRHLGSGECHVIRHQG